MPDHLCQNLPTHQNWRFDEIVAREPDRVKSLEDAGSPEELLKELDSALDRALCECKIRYGWEQAKKVQHDCRAVVQFEIGSRLFDWFFNGRTGYRAHFRAHYACGLEFNAQIIELLRSQMNKVLPNTISARLLNSCFEDVGAIQIASADLFNSLEPSLSKIWLCANRLRHDGGIEELATGVVGPKILLQEGIRWPAFYLDQDSEAWLQLNGAFVGAAGLYQPKDPIIRAKHLAETGLA
jgi:hypothetical protein